MAAVIILALLVTFILWVMIRYDDVQYEKWLKKINGEEDDNV
jgi:succinate dehydrogenase hydrophobic anchor subunit